MQIEVLDYRVSFVVVLLRLQLLLLCCRYCCAVVVVVAIVIGSFTVVIPEIKKLFANASIILAKLNKDNLYVKSWTNTQRAFCPPLRWNIGEITPASFDCHRTKETLCRIIINVIYVASFAFEDLVPFLQGSSNGTVDKRNQPPHQTTDHEVGIVDGILRKMYPLNRVWSLTDHH